MSTFAALVARLASFVGQAGTGVVDHAYACQNRTFGVDADITNAAVQITLVGKTPYLSKITDGHFIPETGVAAAAASLSARLFFDDGAGAGATALSAIVDGTAVTTVSFQRADFPTLVTAQSIPVGSRIYAAITVNGAGAVWNDTQFEVEIAFD